MRDKILRLLSDLDAELTRYANAGERLDLYLIGRAALILQLGVSVTTDDVDIVEMFPNSSEENLEKIALKLFGEDTANAERLGLYLDQVPQGLPPVPHWFRSRCSDVPGDWQVIRPKLMDFHDYAVTKLKRFHAKDREDLKILCDQGLLTPKSLAASLDNAFTFAADEEEDPMRKRATDALKKVINYIETGISSF
jgi:hypothetical protein